MDFRLNMDAAWPRCLERLEAELPAEEIHAWLRPLQAEARADGLTLPRIAVNVSPVQFHRGGLQDDLVVADVHGVADLPGQPFVELAGSGVGCDDEVAFDGADIVERSPERRQIFRMLGEAVAVCAHRREAVQIDDLAAFDAMIARAMSEGIAKPRLFAPM